MRDTQLDIYRGLLMIYILCVVHTGYLINLIAEPWKSIILIEMPIMFFISGAALSLSTKKKGLIETAINRARRVLYPYFIYIILTSLFLFIRQNLIPEDPRFRISTSIFLNAFFPIENQLPIANQSHFWFIIPYFIVALLFVFQRKVCEKVNRWYYMLFLLVTSLLSTFLPTEYFSDPDKNMAIMIIREIVIYNFFLMAGYLFYRKTGFRQILTILIISLTTTVILLAVTEVKTMQEHKFPPDMLFLSFGLTALCLLSLILGNIKLPSNKLIRFWNKDGYTIYIWQSVFFLLFSDILERISPDLQLTATPLNFAIGAISIFILATVVGYFFARIEHLIFHVLHL